MPAERNERSICSVSSLLLLPSVPLHLLPFICCPLSSPVASSFGLGCQSITGAGVVARRRPSSVRPSSTPRTCKTWKKQKNETIEDVVDADSIQERTCRSVRGFEDYRRLSGGFPVRRISSRSSGPDHLIAAAENHLLDPITAVSQTMSTLHLFIKATRPSISRQATVFVIKRRTRRRCVRTVSGAFHFGRPASFHQSTGDPYQHVCKSNQTD